MRQPVNQLPTTYNQLEPAKRSCETSSFCFPLQCIFGPLLPLLPLLVLFFCGCCCCYCCRCRCRFCCCCHVVAKLLLPPVCTRFVREIREKPKLAIVAGRNLLENSPPARAPLRFVYGFHFSWRSGHSKVLQLLSAPRPAQLICAINWNWTPIWRVILLGTSGSSNHHHLRHLTANGRQIGLILSNFRNRIENYFGELEPMVVDY